MNKIEIISNRTDNDIHVGDIYKNKKTGRLARVLEAAHHVGYIVNERKLIESRVDFISNHKFKRRG